MSKNQQIKSVKGMNDLLPSDSGLWLRVEQVMAEVLNHYGYAHIRTPMLESTSLFARSIGAETDIVAKEMYTFDDRNGDSLTLRPEGTASCVRAGIENGLFYNQKQRLWYSGPMFRHERPQKGRYRQFYQLGAEAYGWTSPDIEAEMISLSAAIMQELGLTGIELQINSLGDSESRTRYKQALVDYLQQHVEGLDDDSKRRLTTNPLRILDSKNNDVQALLEGAPCILDFISDSAKKHFETLQGYLQKLDIKFEVNQRLVRGLDYYNDTVFEWLVPDFAAQSAVCGGGRYDGLVEQLGGAATPAFGFAMGMERLMLLLKEQQANITDQHASAELYIVSEGELARSQALCLQRQLSMHQIASILHCGDGSMKNQFKHADKSGAKLVLVIDEQEAQQKNCKIRPLFGKNVMAQEQTILQQDALNTVTNLLESL